MKDCECSVFLPDNARARETVLKPGSHADWACARTATSVRGGECLVKVQVHDVEAHVAWTDNTQERVHIRSVIVEETAAFVHELGDFPDFTLEKSEGIRVGHHYAGDVVPEKRLEIGHIHESVSIGLNHYHVESADCGAGRIGSVRAVRHNNLGPLQVTPEKMVLAHYHESGQLAVRSRARIEGESGHSGDGGKGLLHIVIYLEGSLNRGFRLERMEGGQTRH